MNTEADNQIAAILGQDTAFMASGRVKVKDTQLDYRLNYPVPAVPESPLISLAAYCKRMAEYNRAALEGAPAEWIGFYMDEAQRFETWQRAVGEAL